MLKKVDQMK